MYLVCGGTPNIDASNFELKGQTSPEDSKAASACVMISYSWGTVYFVNTSLPKIFFMSRA